MEWVTNLGGVSVKRIWSRYFSITMLKCFNGFTILNRKGKIAHWTRPFPRQKNPTAYHTCVWQKGSWSPNSTVLHWQGCIIRSILPSGMGGRGVHGDVFLFSNLGALWISLIFIACLFKGSQEQSFFLQTLLFTAFLVTVLKILTCIRNCEHMILGQLRMGARQAKNAPLQKPPNFKLVLEM